MNWREYEEKYGETKAELMPHEGGFYCHSTDRPCAGSWWICEHGYKNKDCECHCSQDLCPKCMEEEES